MGTLLWWGQRVKGRSGDAMFLRLLPRPLTRPCWVGAQGRSGDCGDDSPGRGGAGALEAGRATWAGGGPGDPPQDGPGCWRRTDLDSWRLQPRLSTLVSHAWPERPGRPRRDWEGDTKEDSIGEVTRAQKGCTAHRQLSLVVALNRDYSRTGEGKNSCRSGRTCPGEQGPKPVLEASTPAARFNLGQVRPCPTNPFPV